MELKFKYGIYATLLILFSFLVVGATSKIYINVDHRDNNVYNVSNLTASRTDTNIYWQNLSNYPDKCPSSSAVTGINDSITCTDSWLDAAGDTATGDMNFTTQIYVNQTKINDTGFHFYDAVNNLWQKLFNRYELCRSTNLGEDIWLRFICKSVCSYSASDCSVNVRNMAEENLSINVRKGHYPLTGNITMYSGMEFLCTKGVILEPSGSDELFFIDGNYTKIHGCRIEADGSTATYLIDVRGCYDIILDNLWIRNISKHGVFFHGCGQARTGGLQQFKNSEIISFGIDSTGYAVYMDYSRGVQVFNNRFEQIDGCACDVIEMGHLGEMSVHDNHIYGTGNKISINYPFAHNSQIHNNMLQNAIISNDLNWANNVSIYDNTMIEVTPASAYGVIRMSGSGGKIEGNTIKFTSSASNLYGIEVHGNDTDITDNTIIGTTNGTGIQIHDNRNFVSGNKIKNVWRGVAFSDQKNTIIGNYFYNVDYGVYAISSTISGIIARNNTVRGNAYYDVQYPEQPGNPTQIPNNYYERYNYGGTTPKCHEEWRHLTIYNGSNLRLCDGTTWQTI